MPANAPYYHISSTRCCAVSTKVSASRKSRQVSQTLAVRRPTKPDSRTIGSAAVTLAPSHARVDARSPGRRTQPAVLNATTASYAAIFSGRFVVGRFAFGLRPITVIGLFVGLLITFAGFASLYDRLAQKPLPHGLGLARSRSFCFRTSSVTYHLRSMPRLASHVVILSLRDLSRSGPGAGRSVSPHISGESQAAGVPLRPRTPWRNKQRRSGCNELSPPHLITQRSPMF